MKTGCRHPARCRSSGAALISALLTVALATILSAQVISAQSESIDRMIGRQDLAQARWLSKGAAEWARAILMQDAKVSRIDYVGEQWATKVPPIPIKSGQDQNVLEGELSGEIEELDGRFNLNRLAPAGNVDLEQVGVFARLLRILGTPEAEATSLALEVADAIDSDSMTIQGDDEAVRYGNRLFNRELLGVGELARLPGFPSGLLVRLQPYLSALPKTTPLNVNTASAEVLAAEFPSLELTVAQQIVAERTRIPFRDVPDLNARFPATISSNRVGVESTFFLVTTRASYGQALAIFRTLLFRSGTGASEIMWQQYS